MNILKAAREATVSITPKGLDFIRAGIAKAVSDIGNEGRYAASRWGDKSRVARITRAAVSAINTQVGAGDQMVRDEGAGAEFFDLVRARSVIGKLPFVKIPFWTRTLSMDEGPRVAWRDEGAAVGASSLKVTSQTGLEPFMVAGMVVVTREMLEHDDIATETIIRDQLVKAIAVEVDRAFLDPANAGTAGVKPASITNGVSSFSSPLEGIFESDVYTGDPENSWLLLNPMQAARRASANRPDLGAKGGTWGGYPVATSSAVPDESIIFLDPSLVAVALGDAEIRVSDQATIELSDSSSMTSGPSVAAAQMTSLFQTNSRAIVTSLTANWRVTKPGSVQIFDAQSMSWA